MKLARLWNTPKALKRIDGKITRDSLYNLLGGLVPLATALLTIPIYIETIGEARFGMLALIWLMLSYFMVFDFGLSGAIAQRIASLAVDQISDRTTYFWTAIYLNLGIGVVAGLICWPLAVQFFSNAFDADPVSRSEVLGALHWLALAVPAAILGSVFNGALIGIARFRELNLITTSSALASQVAPLAVAYWLTPDIRVLVPVVVTIRILTSIVLFFIGWELVCGNRTSPPSRKHASSLFDYGKWLLLNSIVTPIMTILDRFLIGTYFGAQAVARYSVAYRLGELGVTLPRAVSSALFPRFADSSSQSADSLSSGAVLTLALIGVPAVTVAILFLEPFIGWWINPDFAADAAIIGHVLLIGFLCNGIAHIPHAKVMAQGRSKVIALCYIAELPFYLVILVAGLALYGPIGAAVALASRSFADLLLQSWLAEDLAIVATVLFSASPILFLAFVSANWIPADSAILSLSRFGVIALTAMWGLQLSSTCRWVTLRFTA